jgi:hypothetical protein
MSIFSKKNVTDISNDKISNQVLLYRSVDELKTYNYKNGISSINMNDIPGPNIYDKLSIKTDNDILNNSSKMTIDNFYKKKAMLIHNDGMGINRFYKLLKDPQANVIENFNGTCVSRNGLDTTQIYKDMCN